MGAYGCKLEAIRDGHSRRDLLELEGLNLGIDEEATGYIFRYAGLNIVQIVRDDCGLAIAVCLRSPDAHNKLRQVEQRKAEAKTSKTAVKQQTGRDRISKSN